MGSNLQSNDGKNTPIWTVNSNAGVAAQWGFSGAETRQRLLDPSKTEVDPRGKVPDNIDTIGDKAAISKRGWGEISKQFYGDFLVWLERMLNDSPAERESLLASLSGNGADQAAQALSPEDGAFLPLTDDEIKGLRKYYLPVHACGYNWLQSNEESAKTDLVKRINEITKIYNTKYMRCNQVILVTHSMGGLVSRACSELAGLRPQIAGIVHGAQPAIGASVAYRRCKVGMWDEDAGVALVMGTNGPKVVAVFSNSPGALQLLPSQDYSNNWLTVLGHNGQLLKQVPESDPYGEIYGVRDKWWGLIDESWLQTSATQKITWGAYKDNLAIAQDFHSRLSGHFHSTTYVFYGDDPAHPSFEKLTWQVTSGATAKSDYTPLDDIPDLSYSQVKYDGDNAVYIDGKPGFFGGQNYTWQIKLDMQDGTGDGTVPDSSGNSPARTSKPASNIKQQFKLGGFEHSGAYENAAARLTTLYSITKIVAKVTAK